MTTADEFKAKGNAALQAGNTTEAIEHYTAAINADGSNHVYYSNRSAAYLKKGDAHNALEDANACVSLKSDFAKGYSRKGAALHSLKRYNDSISAYESGLAQFPADKGLLKGLEDVKREKDKPAYGSGSGEGVGMGGMPGMGGQNPFANMFGPDTMAKMALDPEMRPLLNDKDFMAKVQKLQTDPNSLTTMLSDPNMMTFLNKMMGIQVKSGDDFAEEQKAKEEESGGGGDCCADASCSANSTAPPKKESVPEPEPMEEDEEDLSELTEEERTKKENQKKALEAKTKGNDLYKSKKFEDALAAYDEAIALDETNMTFVNNKAAVYFTTKQYDECIETCLKAVEVGKSNMAPFEDRAKAYTRCAKAYQKKGDLAQAIEMCNSAQLESFDKATQRLLKTLELEKRQADKVAYHDDEKAEEAKQRGNEQFRAKNWGAAVKEYEEAVKRAPKNAAIRNNLSAALCKIMDFNGAKNHIQVALDIDPTYVKAYARKGDIEIMMKEYHKALDSYQTGLNHDSENKACKEGLRKTTMLINQGQANMTEDERKERAEHAMADPDIQNILQDPIIQQVLRDLSENPAAGQEALRDPGVSAKIQKLIAAGIIETR
mmetsp:Transcript_10918/g.15302  ORF Transcript_10918/g.15302 Transcript_10918/m.15302 type:complete len:604 (+) Transcript_10918:73-1884(+)